jgi:hypothetical protein
MKALVHRIKFADSTETGEILAIICGCEFFDYHTFGRRGVYECTIRKIDTYVVNRAILAEKNQISGYS